MGNRLKYIEDGGAKPLKIEEPEPLEEKVNYPVLARYDFAGNGPRPGVLRDEWMYTQAGLLLTKGERLSPPLKRIGWLLIRLAIGLALVYLFLHGSSFDCMGTRHTWR